MIRNYRAIAELDALHQEQHRILFQNCLGIVEVVAQAAPTIDSLPVGYMQFADVAGVKSIYFNVNGVIVGTNDYVDSKTTNKAIAPSTNSADYIPQWDGANSKTLKNGLMLDTDEALAANSDSRVPSQQAVKAYADSGRFVFSTTSVFNGNSPTSATDLDVSAVVGANLAICFLRLHLTGAAHNFQFVAKGYTRSNTNSGSGPTGGVCATNEDLYIMVPTNSSGVISWLSDGETACTINFVGYWK